MIYENKIYTYTNRQGYTTRVLVTRITDKSVFVKTILNDGTILDERREGRNGFEKSFTLDINQKF